MTDQAHVKKRFPNCDICASMISYYMGDEPSCRDSRWIGLKEREREAIEAGDAKCPFLRPMEAVE